MQPDWPLIIELDTHAPQPAPLAGLLPAFREVASSCPISPRDTPIERSQLAQRLLKYRHVKLLPQHFFGFFHGHGSVPFYLYLILGDAFAHPDSWDCGV